MVPKRVSLLFSVFLILSCGGGSGEGQIETHVPSGAASPLLTGVDPPAGSPGTSVRIEGTGFSLVAQENVIATGGAATVATVYGVTGDSEFITFEVPAEAVPGEGILFVTVAGEVSNSLTFTVVP